MPLQGYGSHPYYLFGAQRTYPFLWSGGAGGVPSSRPAAETRELSGLGCSGGCGGARAAADGFDLVESGLEPYSIPFPAFNRTRRHTFGPNVAMGDWPAIFPAGPEVLDPGLAGIPIWDGLSDNEKKLVGVLGAAGLAYYLWKRRGKKTRRNPARRRKAAGRDVHFDLYITRNDGRRIRVGPFLGKRETAQAKREALADGARKVTVRRS